MPSFVVDAKRVTSDPSSAVDSAGPELTRTASGPHWLVVKVDPAAAARLQQMLHDPALFGG